MVPSRLPPGDYELTLRSRQPNGKHATSPRSVAVAVQPGLTDQNMALMTPDKATVVPAKVPSAVRHPPRARREATGPAAQDLSGLRPKLFNHLSARTTKCRAHRQTQRIGSLGVDRCGRQPKREAVRRRDLITYLGVAFAWPLTDSALYPTIGQIERAAGFTHDDTPEGKGNSTSSMQCWRRPRPRLTMERSFRRCCPAERRTLSGVRADTTTA